MKRILSIILCLTFFAAAFSCYSAAAASAEESSPAGAQPAAVGSSEGETLHVPRIRIVTEEGNGTTLQKEDGYVNAAIEITDTDGTVISDSVSFKVRGNGTALASIKKKAYTFKFSKKRDVLGLGKGKKWALLANAMDVSLLRTSVAMDLAQKMGIRYTSDSRMVEVWVDGSFRGLYLLIEPIQEGKDRVNIDIEGSGGMKDFLLEREASRTDADVTYIKVGGIRLAISEPETPTAEQVAYITGVMTNVVNTMQNGTEEEIRAVVDIDSFAKFYLLNEYVKTPDFDFSSVFFYYQDGKFCAGPPWDYDHSLGSCSEIDLYTEANRADGLYADNMHFYKFLCQYDWFMDEAKKVFTQNRDYIESIALDGGLIDALAAEYSEEIERNYTLTEWKVTRHWSYYQRKPLPTYQENLDFLKSWCQARVAWMDEYFTIEAEPLTYMIGDADGDGSITVFDATIIQRLLVNLEEDDGMIALRGDADGDGLSVFDATEIQRWLVGLTSDIPIGETAAVPYLQG